MAKYIFVIYVDSYVAELQLVAHEMNPTSYLTLSKQLLVY